MSDFVDDRAAEEPEDNVAEPGEDGDELPEDEEEASEGEGGSGDDSDDSSAEGEDEVSLDRAGRAPAAVRVLAKTITCRRRCCRRSSRTAGLHAWLFAGRVRERRLHRRRGGRGGGCVLGLPGGHLGARRLLLQRSATIAACSDCWAVPHSAAAVAACAAAPCQAERRARRAAMWRMRPKPKSGARSGGAPSSCWTRRWVLGWTAPVPARRFWLNLHVKECARIGCRLRESQHACGCAAGRRSPHARPPPLLNLAPAGPLLACSQDYQLVEDNTGIRRQRPQQQHRRIKRARDAEGGSAAQQQDAARALQVGGAGGGRVGQPMRLPAR